MIDDEIYDEGFDAGSHGEPQDVNPYLDNEQYDAHVLWNEGWQDGADASGLLDEEEE